MKKHIMTVRLKSGKTIRADAGSQEALEEYFNYFKLDDKKYLRILSTSNVSYILAKENVEYMSYKEDKK